MRPYLQAEGATFDEDRHAESDQDQREQDVLPAFQDLCDGPTGGDELGEQDKHHDEDEEDDAVGHDRAGHGGDDLAQTGAGAVGYLPDVVPEATMGP